MHFLTCLLSCLRCKHSETLKFGVFIYLSSQLNKVCSPRSCSVTNECAADILTLSRQRSLSYRNQSIDLLCKSMDWFLYDDGLRNERDKFPEVTPSKTY